MVRSVGVTRGRRAAEVWSLLVVTLLIWTMFPTNAKAVPPQNCSNAAYNVEGSQSTQQGNHQGVRGDVDFPTPNNECARVSSIAVLSGSGNGVVEWGWQLGWYTICDSAYASSPRLFMLNKPNNGVIVCTTHASLGTPGFRNLLLADGNSDTIWDAKLNGNPITNANVNFDRGTLVTNGERDCTCDSAFSHFKALKFQVAGSATWFAWSSAVLFVDNDPGFKWTKLSETAHKVEAG